MLCWQDKRNLHPHQHVQPPSIMSFCGWRRKCIKTSVQCELWICVCVCERYNGKQLQHSCMAWKWPKKLFFHLPDLTIKNSFIIHISWEGKITHEFYMVLSMSHGIYTHVLQLQAMVSHLHEKFAKFTSTSRIQIIGLSRAAFEFVMSDLLKEKSLGHVPSIKTVMLGSVYLCFKLYHTRLSYRVSLRVKSDLQQCSPLMHNSYRIQKFRS